MAAVQEDDESLDIVTCDSCGRNFNSQALTRHEPICRKSKSKPRRVFDASKQRLEGSEMKPVKTSYKPAAPSHTQTMPTAKKSNWRQQHAEFVNTIRAARSTQNAVAAGKPLPPPPPPALNPDYVSCPYCSRRFNESAAQRHIVFCKTQHDRLPHKKADPQAKTKQDIRTQYRAPRPKVNGFTAPGRSSGYGSQQKSGGYNATTAHQPARGASYHEQPIGGASNNSRQHAGNRLSYDEATQNRRPSPGRALRTGRTSETYSEARLLSAKQRQAAQMPGHMPGQMPAQMPGQRTPSGSALYDRNGGDLYDRSCSSGSASVGVLSPASDTPPGLGAGGGGGGGGGGGPPRGVSARFCHECGTRYPVSNAKFCCECGMRRLNMI